MVFRAFIAVEVDGDMLRTLSKALGRCDANLKLVDLENVHLTLKFLGNTEEALIPDITAAIEDAASGIEPFTIQVKGVGAFPSTSYIKVVWAGVQGGEPLVEMARKLSQLLQPMGFKRDKKGFSPHVTLARVKSVRDKASLVNILEDFKNQEFGGQTIDSVHLKKSVLTPKGPIYSVVSEVGLQ